MLDPIARVEDDKGVLYVDLSTAGLVLGVELHVKAGAQVYCKVYRGTTTFVDGIFTPTTAPAGAVTTIVSPGVHRYAVPKNRQWTYDDIIETGFGYSLGTA